MKKIFLFEFVFKGLCLFIFAPAGSALISQMLEISGQNVLFNFNMARLLLSMPGIAAVILILLTSSALTYFEFSVIFLMIKEIQAGSRPLIKGAMEQSMLAFMRISGPGIIGYFIYTVLLLPFEGIIFRPSIMPALHIPNFITGEFSKRWYGPAVLDTAYLLVFIIFLLLLFVLPSMILARQDFFHACKKSLKTWRHIGVRYLIAIVLFMTVYIIIFIRPGIAPKDFSGLFEENMLKTLCMLFFSPKSLLAAALAVFLWALKTILMILFAILIVSAFIRSERLVFLQQTDRQTVKRDSEAIKNFGSAKSMITKGYVRLCQYLGPIFRQVHIRRSQAILALSAILAATLLFVYNIAQEPPSSFPLLNIGHRGSDLGVENTLPAVEGAVASGADYVELDIQLSKDHIPVAIHDGNLSRLAGSRKAVSDLTAAQLKEYTLSQNEKIGVIPTLEEIIIAAGQDIGLLIELKAGTPGEKELLVDQTLALIEKYHIEEQCILMSLDYDIVSMAKNKRTDLNVGYCMFGNLGTPSVSDLIDLNVDFVVIEEAMVNKNFVTTCRRAWLPVYVWTVDDAGRMKQYLEMGVTGLISDKPYVAKEIIEQFI